MCEWYGIQLVVGRGSGDEGGDNPVDEFRREVNDSAFRFEKRLIREVWFDIA